MGVPTDTVLRDGRASECEATIVRFRRTYRRRLRKLARLGAPFADLVVSFPAAAFALATEYGTTGQRREAVEHVKHGRPLKVVAKALGLPLWTRKLPPETLSRALPEQLPSDPDFGARLSGAIPQDREAAAGWLNAVLEGWRYGGDGFALWLARQPKLIVDTADMTPIQLLGLHAWFSERQGLAAGKFLDGRWSDEVSAGRAAQRTAAWLSRVTRELVLGQNGLTDPWLAGGNAAGYRIVPITGMADLEKEVRAMNNCVMDYADILAKGECRLFGVRRGSTHVATLEIRPHRYQDRMPEIIQLRGVDNAEAPDRVWAAVFTWLGKQKSFNLPTWQGEAAAKPDPQTWTQLWRPYWREQGPHPLLPETPFAETLGQLHLAAREASRRAARA